MLDHTINFIKLTRPKQWIKNFFVFAPLIFSGQFFFYNNLINSLITLFLFILASSITYIINDCFDLKDDANHPTKKITRPIASGKITKNNALRFAGLLSAPLFIICLIFNAKILIIIFSFIIINFLYSIKLKQFPIIDIFIISIGFILRIYAGAESISVYVSPLMLLTTLGLGLYLASLKRHQELKLETYKERKVFKFYNINLLNNIAKISAYITIIFYCSYVVSNSPKLLITIPLVLYGIYRYWFVVHNYNKGESPTDTILSDKQIILIISIWFILIFFILTSNIEN